MMKKLIEKYKTVLISIVALAGFFMIGSVHAAHADSYADYTVGGNGWTGNGTGNYYTPNQWQNYWGGSSNYMGYNGDGMHKYNATNTAYYGNNNAPVHYATYNNTMSYNGTNGYTDNNFYPKVVHGLPPQVRTGQDMYNPMTGQYTGVRAYTQSVTPIAFKTTICAQDNVNGYSVHLGCVPEAPYTNAANGPAMFDFNVWPVPVAGNHSISYTYRDAYGNWVPIQTPWYHNYNVNFSS